MVVVKPFVAWRQLEWTCRSQSGDSNAWSRQIDTAVVRDTGSANYRL